MNDPSVVTEERENARANVPLEGADDGAAFCPSTLDALSTDQLLQRYCDVRGFSERLAEPLAAEDCVVQSMDDASPIKWHLAHTTWFFETFLLKTFADYQPKNPEYEYLFNSYYNTVGEQYPRAKRGLISRPGMGETLRYRGLVDQEMIRRFDAGAIDDSVRTVLLTGLHHEQQHQELMLTDLKHALSCNPTDPVYRGSENDGAASAQRLSWIDFNPGVVSIGYNGADFSYDNEGPCHRVFLERYQLADRCVTNREYIAFIEDGGYQRPELWLSLGWSTVADRGWRAPLYWQKEADRWSQFSLCGRRPIRDEEPVTHVSYFEADAFARWAGCRLPTEGEWEHAACQTLRDPYTADHPGNWSDRLIEADEIVCPKVETAGSGPLLRGLTGNTWQWTSSHYSPYPGYTPPDGALGEYNGKFMCNVFVLRGGSCATPSGHVRASYRNFFAPETRWQFSGIRLARS